MMETDIQHWIDNADRGMRENKINFVLSSSKNLKSINRADLAEKILKDAFVVFSNNVPLFRELSNTIIERNPNEGLQFAIDNVDKYGNHARFQEALSLSKLGRKAEATSEIENILKDDQTFVDDRFVISKLVSLYNDQGRFDTALGLLEPLIDSGIFKDLRMKQLLATVLIRLRRTPSKVLELLDKEVDPRSTHIKREAADILALIDTSKLRIGENISIPIEQAPPSLSNTDKISEIFLVHGQDNEAKQTVARFIEKLGLNVTILHEQPSRGRTIIEKFEDYSRVDFAVVLLTGDDVGATVNRTTDLKHRARQNVILELGYFLGALGRKNVCALKEEDVEVPSDFTGIVYVPLDASDTWKLLLAKEIKAAGISVDLNQAI